MLGHYTELESTEKVCRRNVKSPIYSLSLFPSPAPSPKLVVVQNGRHDIFLLGLIKFEVFRRHCTGPEAWTLCMSGRCLRWLLHPLLYSAVTCFFNEVPLSFVGIFVCTDSFWGCGDNWFKSIVVNTVFTKSSFLWQDIWGQLVWFKGRWSPALTINPMVMEVMAAFTSNTPRINVIALSSTCFDKDCPLSCFPWSTPAC